jgi:hypothetical protein
VFLEFKILSVTCKVTCNSSSDANPLGFTQLLAAVFHSDQTAATLPDIILKQYKYYEFNPRSFGVHTVKWMMDSNDGDENQFSVVVSSAASNSFGGIWFYLDGPAASVGQVPFAIVTKVKCLMIGSMASTY